MCSKKMNSALKGGLLLIYNEPHVIFINCLFVIKI